MLDRDDHRRLIEDAIGDLDFSVLERESALDGRRAPHLRARALPARRRSDDRLDVVHEQLGDFVAAIEAVPELRSVLENPELDSQEKAGVLEEILGGADELVRNFVLLVAEKGRAGELEEIYRELERLVAEAQRRLTVELTTAYELSDDEAASITKKIEQASGRDRRGDAQASTRS